MAIKLPNPRYSFRNFLQGLLANMAERDTWRNTKSALLCPVIWASWGGWIVVMQRVETVFTDETGQEIDYTKWIVEGFGGDDKPDNYGTLAGKVIKLDYA